MDYCKENCVWWKRLFCLFPCPVVNDMLDTIDEDFKRWEAERNERKGK